MLLLLLETCLGTSPCTWLAIDQKPYFFVPVMIIFIFIGHKAGKLIYNSIQKKLPFVIFHSIIPICAISKYTTLRYAVNDRSRPLQLSSKIKNYAQYWAYYIRCKKIIQNKIQVGSNFCSIIGQCFHTTPTVYTFINIVQSSILDNIIEGV